jgi:hypothetical protein
MRTKQGQGMRNIEKITDAHGKIHYDIPHILQTFTTHLQEKYASIPVNAAQMHRMGSYIKTRLSIDANTDLEAPVTLEEIKTAFRKGKKGKSPGSDGISHEFYTENWCTIQEDLVEIIRQMHSEGIITPQQNTLVLLSRS